MDLSKLSSQDLNSLFNVGCFFILNDLPLGTHFAIDGSSWLTGTRFQGIKLIPPGFHIITITPASNQCSDNGQPSQGASIGYQVRKGLIRFFKPQEKIFRSFDPTLEDFKKPHHHHDDDDDDGQHSAEQTITSLEYMKTIDSQLAPYPMKDYDRWKALTHYITPEHVSRIIGFDGEEDGLLDSLISNHISLSSHPPPPLSTSLPHRTQWGKPRAQNLPSPTPHPDLHIKERTTFWPFIDLKRSWPKDAVGPELTKWSRDKSWLFHHLMLHQFQNDPNEVLGLLQLSFITFIEIQSIQSFEFYQSLMNLVVKSSLPELIKLDEQKAEEDGKSSKINYVKMMVDLICVFSVQLKFLTSTFFSESMEDFQIENWFFGVLDRFRKHMNYILGYIVRESHGRSVKEPEEEEMKEGRELDTTMELRKRLAGVDWRAIQVDCKRFDWNVKDLKVSVPALLAELDGPHDHASSPQPLVGALLENGLDSSSEEDSDGSSDEEDEEFKPVVVLDQQ